MFNLFSPLLLIVSLSLATSGFAQTNDDQLVKHELARLVNQLKESNRKLEERLAAIESRVQPDKILFSKGAIYIDPGTHHLMITHESGSKIQLASTPRFWGPGGYWFELQSNAAWTAFSFNPDGSERLHWSTGPLR